MTSVTPDLLPGEHWCRSCQRPESEVRFYRQDGFICVECSRAARALYWYWRRKELKAGARQSTQTQARTQVREVAAA